MIGGLGIQPADERAGRGGRDGLPRGERLHSGLVAHHAHGDPVGVGPARHLARHAERAGDRAAARAPARLHGRRGPGRADDADRRRRGNGAAGGHAPGARGAPRDQQRRDAPDAVDVRGPEPRAAPAASSRHHGPRSLRRLRCDVRSHPGPVHRRAAVERWGAERGRSGRARPDRHRRHARQAGRGGAGDLAPGRAAHRRNRGGERAAPGQRRDVDVARQRRPRPPPSDGPAPQRGERVDHAGRRRDRGDGRQSWHHRRGAAGVGATGQQHADQHPDSRSDDRGQGPGAQPRRRRYPDAHRVRRRRRDSSAGCSSPICC